MHVCDYCSSIQIWVINLEHTTKARLSTFLRAFIARHSQKPLNQGAHLRMNFHLTHTLLPRTSLSEVDQNNLLSSSSVARYIKALSDICAKL